MNHCFTEEFSVDERVPFFKFLHPNHWENKDINNNFPNNQSFEDNQSITINDKDSILKFQEQNRSNNETVKKEINLDNIYLKGKMLKIHEKGKARDI